MQATTDNSNHTLPRETVLSFLNDDGGAAEKLLSHYERYIKVASLERTVYGCKVNEDVFQEMCIALIKCIPILRNKITGMTRKRLASFPSDKK